VSHPPLFSVYFDELADFVQLKGSLVLYMLNKRMTKGGGSSVGLNRVIPKILVAAMSGEMLNNGLSTHSFLRVCRKVSNVEVKGFAEQWIYGRGCPRFHISYMLNRKKMAVEFTLRQSCTNAGVPSPLFTVYFFILLDSSFILTFSHIRALSRYVFMSLTSCHMNISLKCQVK
jgi:transcription initiation factor TFIID subunit 2